MSRACCKLVVVQSVSVIASCCFSVVLPSMTLFSGLAQ